MAHWSENATALHATWQDLRTGEQPFALPARRRPAAYLLCLPLDSSDEAAAPVSSWHAKLLAACTRTHEQSTICILATPPEAARLLMRLPAGLRFQLWIAVKRQLTRSVIDAARLPEDHAALLILTRYSGALRHTRTRIRYTRCPACRRTTKDYGGKKHTYHAYGTLMSDVWRDLSCDAPAIAARLGDLFGLSPYEQLHVVACRPSRGNSQTRRQRAARTASPSDNSSSNIGTDRTVLVNDDCLAALRRTPDNCIDYCFADPPYNIKKKYDRWDDGLEIEHYFKWCDAWLSQLGRVLRPGRILTVVNIPLWCVRHFQHLPTFMRYHSWIAWEGLSLPVRMIMPAHYGLLSFSKGPPAALPGLENAADDREREALSPLAENFCLRANCIRSRRLRGLCDRGPLTDLWNDIHRLKHNSKRVDHPCQLPPQLMRRLFALFTRRGETVLDCFNGAGTSTLVAAQMGRQAIGIELSRQYHELARARHASLAAGGDPFAKSSATPASKNSRVQRLPKRAYAVPKKTLQLEVRRIARELGRLPSREDVARFGAFPLEYYEKYFISWGEVCAAARTTGMSDLPDAPEHGNVQQMRLPLQ